MDCVPALGLSWNIFLLWYKYKEMFSGILPIRRNNQMLEEKKTMVFAINEIETQVPAFIFNYILRGFPHALCLHSVNFCLFCFNLFRLSKAEKLSA